MQDSVPYNEPELLRQVAEGSETAFRSLFDAYRKKLYTYIYKVTGVREVSEDIVQDIFLRLWTMREQLPSIQHLNAYLHKAAHHAAYNALEKVAKEELVLHVLKTGSGHAHNDQTIANHPERQLLSREIRQQINKLVEQLTPRQKEVFLLSREGGLKKEEIAQQLGIGYESVKTHLADALKFLRAELKDQYGAGAIAIFVIYQLGNV